MSNAIRETRQVCEDYLREQISSNNKAGILASENRVAERLLAHGEELADGYDEICAHLRRDGIGWKIFLGCLLSAGAFWSPNKLAEYRADRNSLIELNRDIAKHARALSDLLSRRDDLHNCSPFRSGTHYDIVAVIDHACAHNGRYGSCLKEPLAQLNARFDMKYWPLLSDCVRVIADDAEGARISASDPLTEAAVKSSRPSKSDFVRALRASIDENRGDWVGAIPRTFVLSNETMATLVNVLLDLSPDEMVDAIYVKNLHYRDKE